jgi:hypothetical protein
MVATLIAGTSRVTDASFVGKTVSAIRAQFKDVYNIPAAAQGTVNGANVADTYVLKANDELIFSKPAGQKGSR